MFLTHVGPIALGHVRKATRKSDRKTVHKKSGRNGSSRRSPTKPGVSSPVEHVIAMDYQTARPNAFVKALGSWIGRVTHGTARRVG